MGVAQIGPLQPAEHEHVLGETQAPLLHAVSQTGVAQVPPLHPVEQAQTSGVEQFPWRHSGSQMGCEHAVPFHPEEHRQIPLGEHTPFMQVVHVTVEVVPDGELDVTGPVTPVGVELDMVVDMAEDTVVTVEVVSDSELDVT